MGKVLISGASGLIGSALEKSLASRGWDVMRLVRKSAQGRNEVQWDPLREINPALVSGYEVVVHLSGESVAGRWTQAKKARIRDSRVVSTRSLAQALASAEAHPQVFLCASAIGFYGDRGDEVLDEDSAPGEGFLSSVCREWEAAAEMTARAGIRTVKLRTGIVLDSRGGAMKQMLLPFRMGAGGRIGDGRQWWSWIYVDDWISAVHFILQKESLRGPVNMTAPNPVTNSEFTKTLAHALKRPAILPVPAFAAKLAFGEFAKEGLLASARVQPQRLLESGFSFQYPGLESALRNLLGLG